MRFLSPRIFLLIGAALMFVVPSMAQDGPPPEEARSEMRVNDEGRPDLKRELGLTPEQRQRIQRMNQARRPLMKEATSRLREANRALDAAIYADSLNEEDVAARLKDFQEAEAEVAKLRFRAELELRKVLTPEQLGKFRDLRERFSNRREERQDMRRNTPPGQRPIKRIRQLPRRGNPI